MKNGTNFETLVNKLSSLSAEITEQQQSLDSATAALRKFLSDEVLAPLQSIQKNTSANGLTKRLDRCAKGLVSCDGQITKVKDEQYKLKRLLVEYSAAMERAAATLPSFTKFAKNGRVNALSDGPFFIATKNVAAEESANTGSFQLPSRKRFVDPLANLGDVQISRRFSKE